MNDSNNTLLISIKPCNDWKDENQCHFPKKEFEVAENEIVCVIGCNGSGKTTLLEQIAQHLTYNDYFECEAMENPFSNIFGNKKEKKGFLVNFTKDFDIVTSFQNAILEQFSTSTVSTGESLNYRFSIAAQVLGKYINEAITKQLPIVILYDDCDVGTSIDMQDDIIDFIRFLDKDLTDRKIKHCIVLTANSYELCKTFKCIDVTTFKEKTFKSYEGYKKFVLRSRKAKDKFHG